MSRTKLTPSEVAQLGGFGRAKALTPERRKEIAEKGQAAWAEKYGKEGRIRLQHQRHGRLATKGKAPAGTEALSQTEGVGS